MQSATENFRISQICDLVKEKKAFPLTLEWSETDGAKQVKNQE